MHAFLAGGSPSPRIAEVIEATLDELGAAPLARVRGAVRGRPARARGRDCGDRVIERRAPAYQGHEAAPTFGVRRGGICRGVRGRRVGRGGERSVAMGVGAGRHGGAGERPGGGRAGRDPAAGGRGSGSRRRRPGCSPRSRSRTCLPATRASSASSATGRCPAPPRRRACSRRRRRAPGGGTSAGAPGRPAGAAWSGRCRSMTSWIGPRLLAVGAIADHADGFALAAGGHGRGRLDAAAPGAAGRRRVGERAGAVRRRAAGDVSAPATRRADRRSRRRPRRRRRGPCDLPLPRTAGRAASRGSA